jgi:hypothetical protein
VTKQAANKRHIGRRNGDSVEVTGSSPVLPTINRSLRSGSWQAIDTRNELSWLPSLPASGQALLREAQKRGATSAVGMVTVWTLLRSACIISCAFSTILMEQLPDEHAKRFIAILNKKAEIGKLMNALGHMTAGLAGGSGKAGEMCFLQYQDRDGGIHPNISHFPFIVLKADNSSKIKKVREEALARGISFTDFTSSMTVGSSTEQQERTKNIGAEELEYYGICLFGDTVTLREFTGKFSLFS